MAEEDRAVGQDELDIERHFLTQTVPLSDGTLGVVFTRNPTKNGAQQFLYNCHLCGVANLAGERCFQTHVSGRKHRTKLTQPSIDAHLFRAPLVAKPKIQMNIAPGEPVPPGFEDEVKAPSAIQGVLNKHKESALIGIEYCVELTNEGKDAAYICLLCDKRGDPRTILGHWASYNHRLKYLEKHFPTVVKELVPYRYNPEAKNIMPRLIQGVIEAIEEHHGRLAPSVCDSNDFKRKRNIILQEIMAEKHFDEKNGPSFITSIDRNLLDIKLPVEEKKRDPSPPIVKAPKKSELTTATVSIRKERKNSLDDISSESDTSFSKQTTGGIRRRKSRSKSIENSSKNSITAFRGRVQRSPPFGEKQEFRSFKIRDIVKNDKKKINLPTPKELSIQASEIANERYKWEKYRCMLEISIHDLEKTLKNYEKNPEKHPLYPEEWKQFWNRRYKELQAEKKDPNKYDFKPEWVVFWTKRMKELHDIEVEKKRNELRIKLCLPENGEERTDELKEQYKIKMNIPKPIPVNNKSKPPTAGSVQNKLTAAVIDISDDELDVSPKKGKPFQRRPAGGRTRSRSRSRSFSRSPSPNGRGNNRRIRDQGGRDRDLGGRDRNQGGRDRDHGIRDRDQGGRDRDRDQGGRDLGGHRKRPIHSRSRTRSRSREREYRHRSLSPRERELIERERERINYIPPPEAANEYFILRPRMPPGPPRMAYPPRGYYPPPPGPYGYRPMNPYKYVKYDNEDPQQKEKEKSPEPVDEGPLTVVAVLRLLTALEDHLGSLGPKVVDLLSKALALEKVKANSADDMLMSDDHCVFFETVKEKLKGQLIADVLDAHKIKTVKKAIKNIAAIIHQVTENVTKKSAEDENDDNQNDRYSEDKTSGNSKMAKNGLSELPFDRQIISSKVAAALVLQERTDITKDEMDKLIYVFILMVKLTKERDTTINVQDLLIELGIIEPPPSLIPEIEEEEEEIPEIPEDYIEEEPYTAEPVVEEENIEPEIPDDDDDNNTSAGVSDLESLTDSDLQTLLQNFKHLSSEEQHHLIAHLKKLEMTNPTRVEKLRKSVNIASLKKETQKTTSNDHIKELVTLASKREPSPKKQLNMFSDDEDDDTKLQKMIDSEDDDDDYNFDDVVKAASKNIARKNTDESTRHSSHHRPDSIRSQRDDSVSRSHRDDSVARSQRDNSIQRERDDDISNMSKASSAASTSTANLGISLSDTQNLIANLMGSLSKKTHMNLASQSNSVSHSNSAQSLNSNPIQNISTNISSVPFYQQQKQQQQQQQQQQPQQHQQNQNNQRMQQQQMYSQQMQNSGQMGYNNSYFGNNNSNYNNMQQQGFDDHQMGGNNYPYNQQMNQNNYPPQQMQGQDQYNFQNFMNHPQYMNK